MERQKDSLLTETPETQNSSCREILKRSGKLAKTVLELSPAKLDRRIIIPGRLERLPGAETGRCLTRLNSQMDFTITRQGKNRNEMTEVMINVYTSDIPSTAIFQGLHEGQPEEWGIDHDTPSPYEWNEIVNCLRKANNGMVDQILLQVLYNGTNVRSRRAHKTISPVAAELTLNLNNCARIGLTPLTAYDDTGETKGRYSRILYARVITLLEEIVRNEEIYKLQKSLRSAFGKVELFPKEKPEISALTHLKDPESLN